jgi:uncharacterized membrane protein
MAQAAPREWSIWAVSDFVITVLGFIAHGREVTTGPLLPIFALIMSLVGIHECTALGKKRKGLALAATGLSVWRLIVATYEG